MSVNFEHIKPWKDLYDECETIEVQVAYHNSDGDNWNTNARIGRNFESMVRKLCDHCGLDEKMIVTGMEAMGYKDVEVTLHAMIEALKYYQILDSETAATWKRFKELRNLYAHAPSDMKFFKKRPKPDSAQIRRDKEKMYTLLYEESWMFAKVFMTPKYQNIAGRQKPPAVQEQNKGKAQGQNRGSVQAQKGGGRPAPPKAQPVSMELLPFTITEGSTINNKAGAGEWTAAIILVLVLFVILLFLMSL